MLFEVAGVKHGIEVPSSVLGVLPFGILGCRVKTGKDMQSGDGDHIYRSSEVA